MLGWLMSGVEDVAEADDTSQDSFLAGGEPQIGQDTRGRGSGSYIPGGGWMLNRVGRVRALCGHT